MGVMTAIESWLREILRCPACRSALRDVTGPGGQPELACTGCSLVYRIDDGIPVLLVDEARDRDADGSEQATPTTAEAAPQSPTQAPGDGGTGPDGL
jgi:uncharacterized protein YbaR (Trm112 family)